MGEHLSPEFEAIQPLEMLSEKTKILRDAFIRRARQQPKSPEALGAQSALVDALQAEEHEDTSLNHGLWICYHLAQTYISAGYIDEAREAAEDGYDVAHQSYDDEWRVRFESILDSL